MGPWVSPCPTPHSPRKYRRNVSEILFVSVVLAMCIASGVLMYVLPPMSMFMSQLTIFYGIPMRVHANLSRFFAGESNAAFISQDV